MTNRPRRLLSRARRASALAGAVMAIGLSFIPALNVGAAEKLPKCDGLKPVSPCVPRVDQVAWFWSSNKQVTVNSSPNENVPLEPSGSTKLIGNVPPPISPGHLGVAMVEGDPDMRAYVMFDTSGIPSGADVTEFTFTMTVSRPDQEHPERHAEFGEGGKPPATQNQGQATIDVCHVSEAWGTSEGDPPTTTNIDQVSGEDPKTSVRRVEPFPDCSVKGISDPTPDGSKWSFDITPIAKKWASGEVFNNGVVLYPRATSISPTWTVELHGTFDERADPTPGEDQQMLTYVNTAEAITTKVEFSGGLAPPPPPPPPADPGPPPAPVPVDNLPSFGNPNPDPGTAPPVTPPAPTQPVAPVAQSQPRTPGWVWAFLPLGALGLGLVSSAVGDDEATMVGADNRVARVLRARRLEGVEGIEPTIDEEPAGG